MLLFGLSPLNQNTSNRVETAFVGFVHFNLLLADVYILNVMSYSFLLGDFACVPVDFITFYTQINIIFSD